MIWDNVTVYVFWLTQILIIWHFFRKDGCNAVMFKDKPQGSVTYTVGLSMLYFNANLYVCSYWKYKPLLCIFNVYLFWSKSRVLTTQYPSKCLWFWISFVFSFWVWLSKESGKLSDQCLWPVREDHQGGEDHHHMSWGMSHPPLAKRGQMWWRNELTWDEWCLNNLKRNDWDSAVKSF